MMKRFLGIFIILHALIHLIGFAKAYQLAEVKQFTHAISKPTGLIWLSTAVLFISSIWIFFSKKEYWWIFTLIALISSQILIFSDWQDAKIGTIANVIVLFTTIIGYSTWKFNLVYKKEVITYLKQTTHINFDLLTELDIQHLPEAVKKYIHYTNSIGKPKIQNFKIVFSGNIRKNASAAWMPFTSEQYNFMQIPTRLFFMKALMKHLPVAGFHCFKNGSAFMDIRLFSLFKVQYQTGREMGIAETVTFFNDMCCMAPATLIDKRINWFGITQNQVKAEFTNNQITISADLYFNEQGALINFISNDRYAAEEGNKMIKIPWSTPLKEYKEINGYKLATYAETIYKYPTGDFCYGNFTLNKVTCNCKM